MKSKTRSGTAVAKGLAGKPAKKGHAFPHFQGDRKKFIPFAIDLVLEQYSDAELRFLCLIGVGVAATQGLWNVKDEPDLVRDIKVATRPAQGAALRQTLPALSDENLDAWACYFWRLVGAHDLGERGEAAVRLALSGANLSGQRQTYPKADAGLYREVHGLIDALPKDRVEAIRGWLHNEALAMKAKEPAAAAQPVAAVV
jgi:hypothetical protein